MGNQVVSLQIIAGDAIKLPSSQILYYVPLNAGSDSTITYIDETGTVVTNDVDETNTVIHTACPLTFPVTINAVTTYLNSQLVESIVTDGATGSTITYDSFSEAANIPFGCDESPTAVQALINGLLNNPTFELVTVTSGLITTTAKYTANVAGTQVAATQLTTTFSDIDTAGVSGASVKLTPAHPGVSGTLKNTAANPIQVFPYTGDTINLGAANASITMQPGETRNFYATDSTNWETNEPTVVAATTFTTTTGITAYATGGQTNAVQLSTYYNNVTVCATANDSVKLLAAASGIIQVVTNNGAAALAVFPYSGDNIDSLAVDTAWVIPAGVTSVFYSVSGASWTVNNVRIATAKGTVALPSHSFIDQVNMGMYWISSTEIGFAVNGAHTTSINTVGVKTEAVIANTEPGTVGAGTVTAVTNGDGRDYTTTLTLVNFIVGAFTPAAAAKAMGNKIYTFPAGAHMLSVSYMSVGLSAVGTANTPKVGVGSVIGVGAVAVLNGTATFMDYITEQTAADVTGTATVALKNPTAGVQTGIALNIAGSVKDVYLNAASTWAVDNTGNLTATGTISFKWTKMS